MKTELVRVEDHPEVLKTAGKLLRSGALVAFPTETVYGLGADGLNADAVKRIYEAKGRPSDNPLILHVSDAAMVDRITREVPPVAEQLMAAFCPGPITLILKRKNIVPDAVTGGLDTVGVRMPEHEAARALIGAADTPIAAPSANLSGKPSPTTAKAVLADMDGRIPLILDGGACPFGVESTIVDCTEDPVIILRPGAITKEMLEEVVGTVRVDAAIIAESETPRAPGMKYRHYAPKAPLILLEGAASAMAAAFLREVRVYLAAGRKVGVLASEEVVQTLHWGFLQAERERKLFLCSYGAQDNPQEIARKIYKGLRAFDATEAELLLGEGVDEAGLGLAIMNRLRKASGFQSIRLEDV